jgi:cellulose biosynthesis protein BcsQ
VLVIAVTSLKGGVGKTSITLGLASAALERGLRTLVVDLDPQGDTTMALQPVSAHADLADVLDNPSAATVRAATGTSAWAERGLDVIVGAGRPSDASGDSLVEPLRQALSRVGAYDLVLIDCPPSLGALTRAGLAAADRAVVVTEPGLFAVMAVGRALRTIDDLRRGIAPQLQPLGIVINRVRPRSTEQAYRLAELGQLYGPLVLSPTIPERAALQQAQGAARPLHSWPGSAARELSTVFDGLLDRVMRSSRKDLSRADRATTALLHSDVPTIASVNLANLS